MNIKIALIFGITGQDGSYLAELLLEKGMKSMVLSVALLLLTQAELIIYIRIHTRKTFV
jgi:GDP-D-mannose dehydratase